MEINNLLGLPAHPLLVHVPVVLVPLAFLGSLMLFRSSWRRMFAVPVAVLACVGAVGVFLAAGSGEELEERVKETELVEDHAEAGETAEPFVAAFALLAVAVAVADQVVRRNAADEIDGSGSQASAGGVRAVAAKALPVLVVISSLSGAVASYVVYEAGHSGAKATWDNTPAVSVGERGEGPDDD